MHYTFAVNSLLTPPKKLYRVEIQRLCRPLTHSCNHVVVVHCDMVQYHVGFVYLMVDKLGVNLVKNSVNMCHVVHNCLVLEARMCIGKALSHSCLYFWHQIRWHCGLMLNIIIPYDPIIPSSCFSHLTNYPGLYCAYLTTLKPDMVFGCFAIYWQQSGLVVSTVTSIPPIVQKHAA